MEQRKELLPRRSNPVNRESILAIFRASGSTVWLTDLGYRSWLGGWEQSWAELSDALMRFFNIFGDDHIISTLWHVNFLRAWSVKEQRTPLAWNGGIEYGGKQGHHRCGGGLCPVWHGRIGVMLNWKQGKQSRCKLRLDIICRYIDRLIRVDGLHSKPVCAVIYK
jgi:hypothetical protein